MASMWKVILTILQFVLAFGLLALFHEMGHFIFAKLFKIDVEEFGLGYPPRAIKLFRIKETLFSINWIPFGAFVKIRGENDPDIPGGFSDAKPWRRILVLLGGPLMNILTAIILFSIIFSQMGAPKTDVVQVSGVNEGSPAEHAGIEKDDIIIEIDATPVSSLEQMTTLVSSKTGETITLVLQRGAARVVVIAVPRVDPPEGEGPLGVSISNPYEPISWFQALPQSFSWTGELFKQFLTLPIRLIRGELDASQARLVSPIGLYSVYAQTRELQAQEEASSPGLAAINIFWFFANISVLLGITNLLPLPALDGGRIIFILPEMIFKKKIPAKFESIVHLTGFVLLLALMSFLFIQDIINPVVIP